MVFEKITFCDCFIYLVETGHGRQGFVKHGCRTTIINVCEVKNKTITGI